jgi:hypothetical protein
MMIVVLLLWAVEWLASRVLAVGSKQGKRGRKREKNNQKVKREISGCLEVKDPI